MLDNSVAYIFAFTLFGLFVFTCGCFVLLLFYVCVCLFFWMILVFDGDIVC